MNNEHKCYSDEKGISTVSAKYDSNVTQYKKTTPLSIQKKKPNLTGRFAFFDFTGNLIWPILVTDEKNHFTRIFFFNFNANDAFVN